MNNTLLIVGDPAGNHTLAALRKYPAESITVWESPSNHYTLKQLSDKINVVEDLQELVDKDMHFDVVIGNPPYQGGSEAKRWVIWHQFLELALTLESCILCDSCIYHFSW